VQQKFPAKPDGHIDEDVVHKLGVEE
jgi:hypothetical protein